MKNQNISKELSYFYDLCRKTQTELSSYLTQFYTEKGKTVLSYDGGIYIQGTVPVLLVAHMDTVHKDLPSELNINITETGNRVLSSPNGIGADDRCGIYMINTITKKYDCHVLFTEDEEIGCVGSKKLINNRDFIKFIESQKINLVIQLDRRNSNDAVYYDCDNPEFEAFVTKTAGLKTAFGSFTDISVLCPEIGIAGVNISCGYYKEHTKNEYVAWEEMQNNINRVVKLIKAVAKLDEPFEYISVIYDKYDDWAFYPSKGYIIDDYEDEIILSVIYEVDGKEYEDEAWGLSVDDCLLHFLQTHPDICWNDIITYYPA